MICMNLLRLFPWLQWIESKECANCLLIVIPMSVRVTILQVLIDNTYFVMRMGLCPSHRSRTKQTSLVTFNILICSQERFSMDTSNICTFCEKAACWNYQFESSHTLGGGKVRTCFLQNQDFFLKKDVSHAGGW